MSDQWELKPFANALGVDALFCDGDWIESKDQDPSGDIRLVQLADILDGEFKQRSERFMTSAKSIELRTTLLKKGDLLIARMPDPIGRACIFPGSDQYCVTVVDIAIARPTQCDAKWLMYYLNSQSVRAEIEARATGSTRKRVSRSTLSEMIVNVPPLLEQKKIAEILSGIDFRISLGEQKISHLEMLLKSLGDKFFGNQTQYEAKTIGEIFEVSSGTTPSRTRQDYFCTNGGTPWVKTMDLTDDYVRTTEEQLTNTGIQEGRARVFPKGTLLIAMYGGWNQIGRTGILAKDSSCNQAMSALLPAKEISPEFLNLQLVIRRAYWRGVAASSRKDPNITKSDIINMPIIIPAYSEQNEITNALRSVIRRKSSEYQYLQSLNLLKSALASDLLSGRKRVTV